MAQNRRGQWLLQTILPIEILREHAQRAVPARDGRTTYGAKQAEMYRAGWLRRANEPQPTRRSKRNLPTCYSITARGQRKLRAMEAKLANTSKNAND